MVRGHLILRSSKVIKTDQSGRQEVYRTDRYGMPIGEPIDERILE